MRIRKRNKLFAGVVCGAIAIVIAVFALERFFPEGLPWIFRPDLATLKNAAACKGDGCSIQGWLSALSGYFAVAAAVIAWISLRHQRRQTDFMLGYGAPELMMTSTGGATRQATFELVNWYRKPIYIVRIGVEPVNPFFGPAYPPPIEVRFNHGNDDGEWRPVQLIDGNLDVGEGPDGWFDRQKGPDAWRIRLRFEDSAIHERRLRDRCFINVDLLTHDERGKPTIKVVRAGALLGHIISRDIPTR